MRSTAPARHSPEAYAVRLRRRKVASTPSSAPARKTVSDPAAVGTFKAQDSALGPFSFDANGDTTLSVMSCHAVKDGKFEFVTLLGESN